MTNAQTQPHVDIESPDKPLSRLWKAFLDLIKTLGFWVWFVPACGAFYLAYQAYSATLQDNKSYKEKHDVLLQRVESLSDNVNRIENGQSRLQHLERLPDKFESLEIKFAELRKDLEIQRLDLENRISNKLTENNRTIKSESELAMQNLQKIGQSIREEQNLAAESLRTMINKSLVANIKSNASEAVIIIPVVAVPLLSKSGLVGGTVSIEIPIPNGDKFQSGPVLASVIPKERAFGEVTGEHQGKFLLLKIQVLNDDSNALRSSPSVIEVRIQAAK